MMIKPERLKRGDKVAIVSLSSGVLGEKFVEHEVKLLEKRLGEFGLEFEYMENSRKGLEYLAAHPEAKAEDLKRAFLDDSVKMVWCAIGGNDAFKTLPYLLGDEEFKKIVLEHPKIFMGFSDTTIHHLMFYKIGLRTYYGPALLPDLAEFSPEMLPYTKKWIEELFEPADEIVIKNSSVWYKPREDFGPEQVGVPAIEVEEERGIEFFGASKVVEGELLGGCLDVLADPLLLDNIHHEGAEKIYEKYPIFPELEEWEGKVLFIETSEEQITPERYRKILEAMEKKGVFGKIVGILSGKPVDEKYIDEYRDLLKEFAEKYNLPTAFNLNFGHNAPRLILPYGQRVEIDTMRGEVKMIGKMVA